MKKPVKRQTNGKPIKRDENGRIVKGSAPLNPDGAPKRGQSWKEIIQEIGEMTPDEARKACRKIFSRVNLHESITLKQAVVMRVFAALLFDPQPGLLNAFMERVEGKVAQPITDMTDDEIRRFIASETGINLSGGDGGETARDSADIANADRKVNPA